MTAPLRDGKSTPNAPSSSSTKHGDSKSTALLNDGKIYFKTAIPDTIPDPPKRKPIRTPLRDGRILLKASSPMQKTSGGSKLAKQRASAIDWFDVDTVYGFEAED